MEAIIVIIKNADWANRFNKEKSRLSKKNDMFICSSFPVFKATFQPAFQKGEFLGNSCRIVPPKSRTPDPSQTSWQWPLVKFIHLEL